MMCEGRYADTVFCTKHNLNAGTAGAAEAESFKVLTPSSGASHSSSCTAQWTPSYLRVQAPKYKVFAQNHNYDS